MERCCTVNDVKAPEPRRCVECGAFGKSVELITLKALLRPAALARLSKGDHSFCGGPSCPVVYFGEGEVFRECDVVVPVLQKVTEGSRTVCYCFEVAEDTIRREVEVAGASASAERIKALVQCGRCACEVHNPQGTCCLGNVAAVVQSARALCVGSPP